MAFRNVSDHYSNYPTMTPNRRLDQLEPLVADALQKIDRLVEGQGQLVEIATRTEQKADTTAKGLANLTIKVNQIADQVVQTSEQVSQVADQVVQTSEQVSQVADQVVQTSGQVSQVADQVSQTSEQVSQVAGQVSQTSGQVDQLNERVNQLAAQQTSFQTEVRHEFQQVNQKFDLLLDLLRKR